MEFLPGLIDVAMDSQPGTTAAMASRIAPVSAIACHWIGPPQPSSRLARVLMISTRCAARMPRRPAVAQADVVEHRFLRRGLGFFVAGQHRQQIVSAARPWACPVFSVVFR